MANYNEIFDLLQAKVDSGELTYERAEEVNMLAYQKYMVDNQDVSESAKEKIDDIVDKGLEKAIDVGKKGVNFAKEDPISATLLLIGVAYAGKKLFGKISGDKKFKANIEKYPEIKEIFKDIEKETARCNELASKYSKLSNKLSVEAAKYNVLAKTYGAPTIKVTSTTSIPTSVFDSATGYWKTIYNEQSITHEQQNVNYDPAKAKSAINELKTIEKINGEVISCLQELTMAKASLKMALVNYKKALRKYKNVLDNKKSEKMLKSAELSRSAGKNINEDIASQDILVKSVEDYLNTLEKKVEA